MVELNEKALPAPDDGLVERLLDPDYAGEMQHLRSWSEIDSIMREAATALQSKDEQIERLTRKEAESFQQFVDANEARLDAEQQVQKLTAENERMREALGNMSCPRPCNDRPDDFDVRDCVAAGECGCVAHVFSALETQEGGK